MTQSPARNRPENLVKYITHTDLFKSLDEAAIRDIEAELEWVHLAPAETRFRQKEDGNCMYVVVTGQISVAITQPDGTTDSLDDLTPGDVFGEVGLFTGQRDVTAIYAVKESHLVELSKANFDRLARKHPHIVTRFSQRMLPRLQRIQLAHAFNKLFGAFSETALQYLEPALEWLRIYHGDVLVQQGSADHALYIVISGRLRVIVEREDGSRSTLSEVGLGECIGELALLTGEERFATVYAIRDTVVVRLTRAAFNQLVEKHPQIMQQITALVARRLQLIIHQLQQSVNTAIRTRKKVVTIALVPVSPNIPLTRLAKQLAAALGSVLHLDSAGFDDHINKAGAAQTPREDPTSLILEVWLSEQETMYDHLIYEVDQDWTPWTRRSLRNADHILLLARAGESPQLGKIERRIQQMPLAVPIELVLLHAPTTDLPQGTYQWLVRRRIQAHHHLRLNNVEDLYRLVRRLTGNAIGLVLGGGVARGFAHIGVIHAIQEAGLPVDLIGGTSIGAIVAAAYALHWDYQTMIEAIQSFMSPRKFIDLTFPLVSIASSQKASQILAGQFQGIQIEDLWVPFFCVSSNLTRARQAIHQHGPLWRYLRSSSSLPGIFAPVVERGDLLVDGGVMNNLPVDIMFNLCQGGIVIASDVSTETDLAGQYQFSDNLSGWKVLWSKLNPFLSEIEAPSLFSTVMRSIEVEGVHQRQVNKSLIDLYINPPVGRFKSGDFNAYEALIEIGYRAAQTAISAWLANRQLDVEVFETELPAT